MGKLSAFDKGYMAYDSGMLEDDNPYHPNSANYLEWRSCWFLGEMWYLFPQTQWEE